MWTRYLLFVMDPLQPMCRRRIPILPSQQPLGLVVTHHPSIYYHAYLDGRTICQDWTHGRFRCENWRGSHPSPFKTQFKPRKPSPFPCSYDGDERRRDGRGEANPKSSGWLASSSSRRSRPPLRWGPSFYVLLFELVLTAAFFFFHANYVLLEAGFLETNVFLIYNQSSKLVS